MTTPAPKSSPDAQSDKGASDSSSEIIYTPTNSASPFVASTHLPEPSRRRLSPSPLRLSAVPAPPTIKSHIKASKKLEDSDSDLELDEFDYNMASNRPALHRPVDGRSHSHQPLLKDEERGRQSYDERTGTRPSFATRRSTFRSRSPIYVAKSDTTQRYTYAAFFLMLSLVSFVVQTETAVYIQHELKWNKHYCMLYLTHGSWTLLWPFQLLVLRIQRRKMPWAAFWRRHKYTLRTTAQMVQSQDLHLTSSQTHVSPIPYMLRTTALVTTALTIAGGSWYIAVDLTSPSDLTAIYNCSAFFAYVFSILLLNDKLRWDKVISVAIAIAGVLVVAYGDRAPKHGSHSGGAHPGDPEDPEERAAENRVLGNLIIGVGSVLYGLYEVLYKKLACPPEGTSPGRGMIFANTFGTLIGAFTLLVLWIPLPILHITGIEPFELPNRQAASLLAISTLSNAVFSGSFLVLMSLTSPVLSSVAALLTIFLVAISDWLITGKPLSPATITGGCAIIVAFVLLSWATYREMDEEHRKRGASESIDPAVEDEEDL